LDPCGVATTNRLRDMAGRCLESARTGVRQCHSGQVASLGIRTREGKGDGSSDISSADAGVAVPDRAEENRLEIGVLSDGSFRRADVRTGQGLLGPAHPPGVRGGAVSDRGRPNGTEDALPDRPLGTVHAASLPAVPNHERPRGAVLRPVRAVATSPARGGARAHPRGSGRDGPRPQGVGRPGRDPAAHLRGRGFPAGPQDVRDTEASSTLRWVTR